MEELLKIDFLITQNCNYRCEYCLQSKKFADENFEEADSEVISAFIAFLKKQTRPVEVTLSGGEPLCHKDFYRLVKQVSALGGKIRVVSNFSYPFESYRKLKEIAGESLVGLFISLHTTQIKNYEDFFNKTLLFNKIKGKTDFTAGAVLTDENCERLKQCAEFFERNNIDFELQHLRLKNSFVNYNKAAESFIERFPASKIKKKSSTFGKICKSGCDYFVIYQNGDCYRCYSSRFNKVHMLGNIKDTGFRLYRKQLPCLNGRCTCPKPIAENMVEFDKSKKFTALLLGAYNLLFLPYFAVKKIKIIKTKYVQAKFFKKQT